MRSSKSSCQACSTWSQASRHFYRTAQCLNGLPGLSGRALARLQIGNATFHFSMRVGFECVRLGIPFVLENPRTSLMWSHPRMLSLSKTRCKDANVDFCQHGTRWRKPTRFRGWSCCQPPRQPWFQPPGWDPGPQASRWPAAVAGVLRQISVDPPPGPPYSIP